MNESSRSVQSKIEPDSHASTITVRTYKYNGTEHRHWRAQISRRENPLIVLDAKFEDEIHHPLVGTLPYGTVSIEYYWLDRWYNVFRFLHPDGELRCFYCNVNVPPSLHKNVLSYIDLDMDILVEPDLSYTVLDEDEFAANALRFKYPPSVTRQAHRALEQLVTLIESRKFPFVDLT